MDIGTPRDNWTKVVTTSHPLRRAREIFKWCDEHASTGRWYVWFGVFSFEKETDAAQFLLVWGDDL